MKRIHRLTSSRDFALAFDGGRRAALASISCVARERGDDGPTRVGIVVGRKIGSAVARSRVKRRLRAAADMALPQTRPGTDVVITARGRLESLNFQELVALLSGALERAGATC